ncbi:MAG: TRAP transporter large permease [Betaproteobacteria bacterium]|nr:TRAP transporter large permease [Betaproteobacteria bacterium]
MDSLLLCFGLILLILIGMPIALAMILLPAGYMLATGAAPLLTVPYQMFEAVAKLPLVAIPFFILTGELMNSSAVTGRILDLSRAIVGRLRGGLAQMNIVSSMFFAGMNGSAVADTATVGTVLIPAMKRAGYTPEFSAAVTAVASTIGGIIPPSIAMIILASAANLSVGALFAGGILPGVLIGLMMIGVTYWIAVRRGYERSDEAFSLARLGRALWRSLGALVIPVVLLGGILGGWFSSVESGAMTAAAAFIVGGVLYRSLTLKDIAEAFKRSVRLSASVFIIIAASGPFAWLLAKFGTIAALEQWLAGFAGNPVLFVLVLIGLILLIGTFLDAPANIIIFGPMFVAASAAAGFAPVQAALVVVVGFLLGMVTPPVGACYFLASYIARARLERVAVEMVPYMLIEVAVLFLMFAVPALTLALPRALGLG